jgi:hypothetical protein
MNSYKFNSEEDAIKFIDANGYCVAGHYIGFCSIIPESMKVDYQESHANKTVLAYLGYLFPDGTLRLNGHNNKHLETERQKLIKLLNTLRN